MTKELYIKLKPFEDQMRKATLAGWVRMTRQELEKFAPLYAEATGRALTPSQRTCPRCVINALKEGWKVYEKYKNSKNGKKVDDEREEGKHDDQS